MNNPYAVKPSNDEAAVIAVALVAQVAFTAGLVWMAKKIWQS